MSSFFQISTKSILVSTYSVYGECSIRESEIHNVFIGVTENVCSVVRNSNPYDDTAIHGPGVKRAKLSVVSGWKGWNLLSLLSIRVTLAIFSCVMYAEQGR